MPMSTQVFLSVSAFLSNTSADLAVPFANPQFQSQVNLDTGTGLNQADKIWADSNTLTASSTTDIDLAGALTDLLGQALTFVRVKGIFLRAAVGNVNNVVLGGAAATQFVGPFGATTHTVACRPGGFLAFIAPDATGWTVGAGASDLLRVGNSGAGSSVSYDIMIIGASA